MALIEGKMNFGEIDAMAILNGVGSLASIAAFVVTVYVALRVRRIETSYVRQAMLPYQVRRLKAHVKNLKTAIRNKDATEARRVLALCNAIVVDLGNVVPKRRRERLVDIQRTADALIRSSSETSLLGGCERFSATLDGELASLAGYEREVTWRKRDVE